ncbi:TPA: hypothetical protein DIU27_03795 [Candidatus Collierbacteria bacterium]|uniref:Uncharacterized protein n=1 Tax=Candidatus Collierbacteria bacterium GW2011_GWB2_44_22 TaxID=1618387 RepID=A0A0G1I0G1_9BACT|nr:MAG: hypothetical protein UW31_C0007G0082 [Candidatus Collierbacteria bacterium GW2011_GWA2_44_13]KKT52313.1 MAG: hypothetical protein UW44_C0003G0156 [Candidatus Collierbacteria bacterium GW2011_GWB2_44_22]KKT63233.1 MAG: hypothetical protein UW56_C0001G0070 [Candidatus Collierbacteria bacterium GW2011_GWD1_44_27]KKT89016.1 MAG: hypothetical protein UW88_C0006G0041 [Candidatus Collierbacteria bacterium GW2011_GWD2_45_10]HCQ31475.1 hypothetical protein [Candidatus Collierbacteria bacterium]
MATLTEASVVARNAIKWGGIGFVGITILWYIGVAAVNYYKLLNPPPLPAASAAFGTLSGVSFPESKDRPKMSLELPTGGIPSFPDRMRVYWAPTKRSGFADADTAVDTATALGFLFKPFQPTETDYVWTNQDQLNSKLEMNIISGHFILTRQWQNNPALATMGTFQSEKAVITETENYIKRIGLLNDDAVGVEKITYLKNDASKLVTALSLSDADFVQLDMFRKNIDEIDPASKSKEIIASYPFYRTDPGKGLVRAVISGSKIQNEKIVYMDYQYTNIDYAKNSTYPIKTGEEAWSELSKGGGYVTAPGPRTGEVKIRRVFLGYYDSNENQKYAMPIYVFLGDQGFTAYVSAVRNEWIAE